jgi:FkbM family methyltransferase
MLAPRPDRTSHGMLMHLDPQEWSQIAMLARHQHEPLTSKLIESLLQPSDTFIDVGSHVGWFSLLAARKVGKKGKVISIDPQPYNCERVMTNAMLNGFDNVLVVPTALGDANDFVTVAQQTARDKARFTLAGPGVNDTSVRYYCPTTRLDTLLARLGVTSAKLMKLDVEGFERQVLAGAASALRSIDNIVVEVLPVTPKMEVDEVTTMLIDAGFELCQVDGSAWKRTDRALEDNVWGRRASL